MKRSADNRRSEWRQGQGRFRPQCRQRFTQVEKYLEQAPLKRAADPDDVADTVIYLATGTTLTTGQVLVVDGGRTM